jgi:hypothetical protein
VVEQRNFETFLVDVSGGINFHKFWIISLYAKYWYVLLHELHTLSQCVCKVSIHSLFPSKKGYTCLRVTLLADILQCNSREIS